MHNAFRFFEWKTAQKEIVNQTEDHCVQADPEREREQGEKSKSRRLD